VSAAARPKIIAVAGNIGAGKSSLVDWLSKQLGMVPFFEPHDENPYLADFYKDMHRWAFQSQLFFLIRRYQIHRRNISQHPGRGVALVVKIGPSTRTRRSSRGTSTGRGTSMIGTFALTRISTSPSAVTCGPPT
jgi:hypothetical protein